MHLLLPDQVPDRRVRDHHLEGEDAPVPARPGDEDLGDDPLEDEGELRADLRLLVGREHVEDPVDRLDARVRVEGREHEVAGLRDGERRLDRFQVPHLADEDDVGVLPKDVFERLLEPLRIGVDLPLVHEALLVRVEILDRVLDRDDVLLPLVVDLVDHRREGGRLSGSGRPGHQNQSPGLLAKLLQVRRESQLLEGTDPERDGAEGAGDGPALHVDVRPEAGEPLDAEGEVEFPFLLEPLLLDLGQDAVAKPLGVLRHERLVRQWHQTAVHADRRRDPRRDVEIGRPLLVHHVEKFLHRHHGRNSLLDRINPARSPAALLRAS